MNKKFLLIFVIFSISNAFSQKNTILSPETFAIAQKNKTAFLKYLNLRLWSLDTLLVYTVDEKNNWQLEGRYFVLSKTQEGLPVQVVYQGYWPEKDTLFDLVEIQISYYPNDSVKTYYERSIYAWLHDTLAFYGYEPNGKLSEKVLKEYDNNLLSLTSREETQIKYRNDGKIRKISWNTCHNYECGSIDTVFYYGKNGLPKRKEITEKYKSKNFEYKTKTVTDYTYNDKNQLISSLSKEYSFDTHKYYLMNKKTYQYDIFGQPAMILKYFYSDTSWIPESRQIITIYPGWLKKRVTQKFYNQQWLTLYREEIYLDSLGRPFEKDLYTFRNGKYLSAERKLLFYNTRGQLFSIIKQQMDRDGVWQNSTKRYYNYYMATNRLKSLITWNWNDTLQLWQYYERKNYFYNDAGLITQVDDYSWNPNVYDTLFHSGDWYKIRKLKMIYQSLPASHIAKGQTFLIIYPNPALDRIILASGKNLDFATVYIYDSQSNLLNATMLRKNELNVSSLKPGKYILKIITPDNRTFYSVFIKL